MEWLVTGTRGGKSGRWKLEAADESSARQKAVAGGVSVQEVRRYPVAQVAAGMVDAPGEVVSNEPSEPEPAHDESPAAYSAAAEQGPSEDEFQTEVGGNEEMLGLTPAGEEDDKPAVAKSPQSTSSPQSSSGKASKRKSLWGMAAIAAGVLGAVAVLIAPARVAAIPLSGVGLLLAIAGIYFSLKRKRAGLLLPALGVVVCAAAIALAVYTWLHSAHQGQETPVPTFQELEDRARAARVAQFNIGVQLVSVRPDGGKYALTFAYKCLDSRTSVTGLDGRLRISDASGKLIESLSVFELFPLGLGVTPVQREGRWTLQPDTARLLEADPSQLKVEFDPSGIE